VKRLASAVTGLLLCAAASGCLTVADDEGPILTILLFWDERPDDTESFVSGTCNSADVDVMEWRLIRQLDEPPPECDDDRDGDATPNADDDDDRDPCVPDEHADACAAGDSDDDGELNESDPDRDLPCDLELVVAERDEECADAFDVLEPSPGEYTLQMTGLNEDDEALWNVDCTGLTVLRFDVAYECDIEAP
jgi:hypothetical protein